MDVSQLSRLMMPGVRPFRLTRWGRLLALALAGTLLLQSGPVRLLVQQVGSGQAEHVCHHCANGVCPRNPEAPCTCVHPDAEESPAEGVVLRSCDRDSPEGLAPMSGPKWQSSETAVPPSPRLTGVEYAPLASFLVPQRLGDEIFRPPRTTPPVRLS